MARHRIASGTMGDIAVIEDKTQTDPAKKYRGLVRVVGVDDKAHMVRRWRPTKAAAREATKRAATDKLAALARARDESTEAQRTADQGDTTTTVGNLITEVMSSRRVLDLAPGTVANYLPVAEAIRASEIAALLPRELDVSQVRKFLDTYTNGHGRTRGDIALSLLNKAMVLAGENRALKAQFNPVAAAKGAVPNKTVRPSKIDHGTPPDAATVVAMLAKIRVDPYYGPAQDGRRNKSAHGQAGTGAKNPIDTADIMAFTFGTGCRIGEASGLEWRHLHLDGDEPWAEISSGGVRGGVRQERTKTKKSDRDIPLNDGLAQQLRERAEAFGIDLTDPNCLTRPVFPSPQIHAQHRNATLLLRAFKATLIAHGIDNAATHVARHYFITSMYDQGMSLSKIADLVGHSSIQQTQSYIARGRQLDADVRAMLNGSRVEL